MTLQFVVVPLANCYPAVWVFAVRYHAVWIFAVGEPVVCVSAVCDPAIFVLAFCDPASCSLCLYHLRSLPRCVGRITENFSLVMILQFPSGPPVAFYAVVPRAVQICYGEYFECLKTVTTIIIFYTFSKNMNSWGYISHFKF